MSVPAALTERQTEVLAVVTDYIHTKGYAPSVREIGVAVGLRSTNGVARHLDRLIKLGHLRRDANKARTLTLSPQEEAA